jgi:flagellar motility protein MotE (MotC chaperone)
METSTASHGTTGDKRNGDHKTRKRVPVSLNILGISIFVITFLLLTKVVISGLYLKLGSVEVSANNLAQAQEEIPVTVPALEEREKKIRLKEAELKKREEALKRREEGLIPLQNEVDSKFEELNELQSSLTAYAKKLAAREKAIEDKRVSHLVSLYSAMEPGKAADIMDKLKTDTVVRILSNMKGKSAGQILANMPTEKGALISEKLSQGSI